jgi:hypothetical protein
MQPPKPSGATAIIAGVLAVLGGLLYLLGLIGTVVVLVNVGFGYWQSILNLVEVLLLVATLLPGGILLFLRKPAGRLLTIIGSGLAILVTVLSVALDAAGVWHLSSGVGGMYLGGAIVGLVLVLVPAGATLTLAIVKPTALWCASGAAHPPR